MPARTHYETIFEDDFVTCRAQKKLKKLSEEDESKFYIPNVIDEKLVMSTQTDKKKLKEFPDRVLIVRRGFGGKDKIRYKTVSGLVKHVSMFDGYDPTQSKDTPNKLRSFDPIY